MSTMPSQKENPMSDRKPRLSDRVRPNVEVAPWVVSAIKKLEAELAAAKVTAFTTCPNCGAGLEDGQCRECIESDAWLREQNATLKARVQRLTDAAHNYMSQFGQALDANDIPYTQAQESVDRELRAALAEGEDTRG